MKKLFIVSITAISFFAFKYDTIAASTYSHQEVSSHNTSTDCWMIYRDKVYNFSDYLRSHDRYLPIDSWCGKDMTEDFEDKAGRGRDHLDSTYSLLNNYYIGDLKTSSNVTSQDINDEHEYEDHEEEYSVEISGQELKSLTIKEVAGLWEIDAEVLLNVIVEEYHLTGNYNTDDTIETLRNEYKLSTAQIKDIAEKLKADDNQIISNNDGKQNTIAKSKNPYNFTFPFFASLLAYLAHWFITKSYLSKKHKLLTRPVFNMFWNTVLVISLIPSALFGFFLIFRYSYTELYNINFDFLWWHVEGSVVFATVSVLHLISRLKQYFAPLKTLNNKP